jgi:hypothetical protein
MPVIFIFHLPQTAHFAITCIHRIFVSDIKGGLENA